MKTVSTVPMVAEHEHRRVVDAVIAGGGPERVAQIPDPTAQ
jgi:hypothetical protein